MTQRIYRCIAALTLSAAMAIAVVVSEDSNHPALVAEGHWCC